MGYFVYAKMTKPRRNHQGQWFEEDVKFRAIDGAGRQVSRLTNACEFTTREDAQDFINSHTWYDGCKLEIRKKK